MTQIIDSSPPVAKIIMVSREKCTGCGRCELACSFRHFGSFASACSRIRVLKVDDSYLPSLCGACEDATCLKVCPVNARVRLGNNAVETDEDRCLGCRACIYSCPFMAPVISPLTKKTITCDQCAGEETGPWCVEACRKEGALRFVALKAAPRSRANAVAESWKGIMSGPKAFTREREETGHEVDGSLRLRGGIQP
ncbi:MAG: 4Fe-4S dicluster domain-containing protein [Smithellaceae bacterium]|nr:4Fe-4S dicluster domain-containing protein [Smithellaceae bacterium]